MNEQYQAYVQNTLVGSSPMELIIALYEGAIEATQQAKRCFETGDIMERSKFISKTVNILTELSISLDMKNGGEMSLNLKRLYDYMMTRVLEAHMKKSPEMLDEVGQLLNSLLESWRVVAAKVQQASELPAAYDTRENAVVTAQVDEVVPETPY